MKNRLRKRRLYVEVLAFKRANHWMTEEDCNWEFMPPVGREFGSPDYEHLMAQDVMEEKTRTRVSTKPKVFPSD